MVRFIDSRRRVRRHQEWRADRGTVRPNVESAFAATHPRIQPGVPPASVCGPSVRLV